MDWYDCPDCSFRHPWPAGEKRCPNIGLTREEVLRIGEHLGRKRGRPLDSEKDQALETVKPWDATGVSRATWFRQQKEKRDAGG